MPTPLDQRLAALWEAEREGIARYIYRRTSDAELAEEVTAQVFTNALEAMRRGNGPRSHVKGWLYRIAHNLVIDHYRRRERQATVDLDEMAEFLRHGDDPHELVVQGEERAKLQSALAMLTAEQRTVMEQRLAGYDFDEIAEQMDKTVGAVKALRHRGMETLRTVMRPATERRPQVIIAVAPNEMTCRQCGEVAMASGYREGESYCVRCSEYRDGKYVMAQDLVATTAYLRPGEYEVRR